MSYSCTDNILYVCILNTITGGFLIFSLHLLIKVGMNKVVNDFSHIIWGKAILIFIDK